MLYNKQAVAHNLRNRNGKRVFYLGKGDQLTSDARDYLTGERIEILPAEQAKPERYRLLCGGYLEEKPEYMTHLHSDVLVSKNHPRIGFRGAMDTLEAEILLCMTEVSPETGKKLEEILTLARNLIRWEVLNEPVKSDTLCGYTQEELRSRSHRPQDYYGIPHFMPDVSDGREILLLNRVRCAARHAELMAVSAFVVEGNVLREDILKVLNRTSSMLYLLMIEAKAKKEDLPYGH